MPQFFDPTPEERKAIEKLADEIPGIQQTLIKNHRQLQVPDRAAHQLQIAGGRVVLKVFEQQPKELEGLGLFQSRRTDPRSHPVQPLSRPSPLACTRPRRQTVSTFGVSGQ